MKKIKKIRMVAKRLNLFKGSTFTKAFSHLFPTTWIKKLTKKQRFYLYVLLGSLLVVLIPLAITTFQNPKKSEAAWFNDNWGYRKPVEITNSGSNQTVSLPKRG
ncbi:MAG: hypothetical protein Q8P80_05500, partial [Candidatus Levybacteria bacterium]|nr:hypothetical protein [Candidatus Levybacteria bacterium]